MAWLEQRGKKYRLSFRLDGTLYRHSLGTTDKGEADACLARLEDSLNRLERGWLKPPPAGADLPRFLLSGGEVTGSPSLRAPNPLTLGALIEGYKNAQATAIESDSLATVGTHLGHFAKSLGSGFHIQALTLDDLQRHVERRRKEPGRRGKVTGYTIRKEVNTLAAAWEWAVLSNKLTKALPNRGLKYPKDAEKPPFQTRAEIERRIDREGLVGHAAEELWDCLFLTLAEVGELLEFVRTGALHPFLYPMVCLAAHTGMRRSELLRCRVADIDLDAGIVVVREKKRLKGKTSTRRVPLSPLLTGVLKTWLAAHPGGAFAFCHSTKVFRSKTARIKATPITRDEAHHHLKQTLAGSKWAALRGWHVLRHSFISNCAARGVDQRLIDAWVGHTTEEMRRRYRHLLPDQSARAIEAVFDGR